MNSIQHEIPIKATKPIVIVPISDIHMGHAGCDTALLKKTVAWIKKSGAYTILLGDLIDAISNNDRRFENDSIAPEFKSQLDNLHYAQTAAVIKALTPIKDRILGSLPGNHENSVKKMFSYDSNAIICEKLGVQQLTDPSYVQIRARRTKTSASTLNIFCTHGLLVGGGKQTGSKVNNLMNVAAGFDADIYLGGHSHKLFQISDNKIGISANGRVVERRLNFVNTGTFQKTYMINDDRDTWASRLGFKPSKIGVARIDVYTKRDENGDHLDVHVRV